jgi:hypothetical protein
VLVLGCCGGGCGVGGGGGGGGPPPPPPTPQIRVLTNISISHLTNTRRVILNIIRPDSGQITWNGKPVSMVPRPTWGYLPEERGYRRFHPVS